MIDYLFYFLAYLAICAWHGMVNEDAIYISRIKWPLVYAPFYFLVACGFISVLFMSVLGEIVVRIFTLGAFGLNDIEGL